MRNTELQPVIEMDAWLSAAQAARILGVTSARIRQMTLAGRLLYVQTPLGRIYNRAEVEALAASREETAAA
jgi:hypothetical protein